MAERSFPFMSVNNDRLYGSEDFRSFFMHILSDGLMMYEEAGVTDPRDSLQCSIDSLDKTTINITKGALLQQGAAYKNDAANSKKVTLPTGTNTRTGYIVARIDTIEARRITIINSYDSYNADTDYPLCVYQLSNTGITSLINLSRPATTRVDLSDGAYSRILDNLVVDSDFTKQLINSTTFINSTATNSTLINRLATSDTLKNRLVSDEDLIKATASNQALLNTVYGAQEHYTFTIDSDTAFGWFLDNNSNYDYTRVLVKTGTWTASGRTNGCSLSARGTTKIVGEPGATLKWTNLPSTASFGLGNDNIDSIVLVDGITVVAERSSIATTSINLFRNLKNVRNCTAICAGAYSVGFLECFDLYNCVANTGRLGFSRSDNLTRCVYNQLAAAYSDGTIRGFYMCNNLDRCKFNGANNITPSATVGAYYGCEGLSLCSSVLGRNLNAYGYGDCKYLTGCSVEGGNTTNNTNDMVRTYGFTTCSFLDQCRSDISFNRYPASSHSGIYAAFNDSNRLSNCYGALTSYQTAIGSGAESAVSVFMNCNWLNFCASEMRIGNDQSLGNGTPGFQNCSALSHCSGRWLNGSDPDTGGWKRAVYLLCYVGYRNIQFPVGTDMNVANVAEYGWNYGSSKRI